MRMTILLFFSLLLPVASYAQTAPTEDVTLAIKALLNQQAADWNRGDLDAFASGYKNSPGILFMGATVRHGYAEMLAGYKARYATRQAMGTLSFSQLTVHLLDEHIATTTGNFHLARTSGGGGDVSGYFLLVLEKTATGWKIVCDDTTVPPATHE